MLTVEQKVEKLINKKEIKLNRPLSKAEKEKVFSEYVLNDLKQTNKFIESTVAEIQESKNGLNRNKKNLIKL